MLNGRHLLHPGWVLHFEMRTTVSEHIHLTMQR